jgi:hypothetical protein
MAQKPNGLWTLDDETVRVFIQACDRPVCDRLPFRHVHTSRVASNWNGSCQKKWIIIGPEGDALDPVDFGLRPSHLGSDAVHPGLACRFCLCRGFEAIGSRY